MYKQGEFLTLENYYILKNEMQSFDLLMFRGDDIVSDTIAQIQHQDQFSHAGLVIHPSLLPKYKLDPNRLYILESTYSYEITGMNNGPADSITGQKFFGVQIRDLETVCKCYIRNEKTKIAWFALESSPDINDFTSIFEKYHKRPFMGQQILPIVDFTHITPEIMTMAKSIINDNLLQIILKSSFSCVTLIISVYHDLKLINNMSSILYPIDLLYLNSPNIPY